MFTHSHINTQVHTSAARLAHKERPRELHLWLDAAPLPSVSDHLPKIRKLLLKESHQSINKVLMYLQQKMLRLYFKWTQCIVSHSISNAIYNQKADKTKYQMY